MVPENCVLDETQTLLFLMMTDDPEAKGAIAARCEMVEVIKAWRHGKLLSTLQTPRLNELFSMFHSEPIPLGYMRLGEDDDLQA
jgi:hypothetical protein